MNNQSIIKCEIKHIYVIKWWNYFVIPTIKQNWSVISSHDWLGMWLLIHAGLKLIHVCKRSSSRENED